MTIVQGAEAIDGNAAAWEARDTGLRSEGARLRLGWMSWLCVAWLVGLAAAAATAGLLPLSDPLATDIANRVAPPSVKFWLGTDQLGRDILARVVYGARVSLSVAFCTALIAAVFGMLLGLPAGYFRGRTEVFLMGCRRCRPCFPPRDRGHSFVSRAQCFAADADLGRRRRACNNAVRRLAPGGGAVPRGPNSGCPPVRP
jgi:hypothetical protein